MSVCRELDGRDHTGTLGSVRRGSRFRLTAAEVARIRALRYGDGLTMEVVARSVGRSVDTVKRYAPGRVGKVPNDKLRAAFEASGLPAAEVARRMGWWVGHDADGSRVKRTLGLLEDRNGKGHRARRRLVDAEIVALLAEAVGVASWEVMPDEDVWR